MKILKNYIQDNFSKDMRLFLKNWAMILIWFITLLIVTQTVGIVIHELGHYTVGKFFGCPNLSISIAKISWNDSISHVSGWESCNKPLLIGKEGNRICNIPTNLISFAGLFFTLSIIIPLILVINKFLKKKTGKFYLKRKYLGLILISVIFMIIMSSGSDLFKIGECLFNTHTGEIIFIVTDQLSNLTLLLFLLFFFIDLIKVKSK